MKASLNLACKSWHFYGKWDSDRKINLRVTWKSLLIISYYNFRLYHTPTAEKGWNHTLWTIPFWPRKSSLRKSANIKKRPAITFNDREICKLKVPKCDCICIYICIFFKVVPHMKLVPECRTVTRQNCETLWNTNDQGKRVDTSSKLICHPDLNGVKLFLSKVKMCCSRCGQGRVLAKRSAGRSATWWEGNSVYYIFP